MLLILGFNIPKAGNAGQQDIANRAIDPAAALQPVAEIESANARSKRRRPGSTLRLGQGGEPGQAALAGSAPSKHRRLPCASPDSDLETPMSRAAASQPAALETEAVD